jgi:3-carboxy-cis,cis-muconate cycloisomerase
MLDFEVALARAEARIGIVPKSAADRIAAAANASEFDFGALSRGMFRAGTPGIPLVKTLTEKVSAAAPEAAGWVHWGATSQDVADTALLLLLKRAQTVIAGDIDRLETERDACWVLATLATLGRWEEFAMHVRAGLQNELEPCDLKELLLQTAIYAGVPAANTGFKIAQKELEEARLQPSTEPVR